MIDRRTFLATQTAFGCLGPSWALSNPRTFPTNPGQLLVTGFRGVDPNDDEVKRLRRFIELGDVAGVILLRRNIQSPAQLSRLISSLQSSASANPIIVAIDQEGGSVTRVGTYNGFKAWMSASELAGSGRTNEEVFSYYAERAQELADVGVNLNLGPVVDLNVNPFNPIIGSKGRSYGQNVADVLRFADLFIRAHRSVGVKTCLKHFPGHGSSVDDTHVGSADVSQTWSAKEISPFDRLIRAELADSVMNSHVLHRYLSDAPWVPTSLSRNSVRELREGLGFNGPVITDDLQMGAITDFIQPAQASVDAVRAGNSILIYSNYKSQYTLSTVSEVNTAIIQAVRDGLLSMGDLHDRIRVVSDFRASLTSLH